jgi:CHAT domain-containing protein
MGAKLWKSLLPKELQQDLWSHRDSFDGIFVLSEEPFIPWELLFMVEPGKPRSGEGRFLAELGLVRWLYEAEATPPASLVVREGRARYAIPRYPEIDEINLHPLPEAEAEKAFLVENFAATAVEPQPAEVSALVAGPDGFDLLHFAGRGFAATSVTEEAQIMLEGETKDGEYRQNFFEAVRVETTADFGASRPLVILNACQAGRADWKLTGTGGFAQAFLSRKAGMFVGTLWSVGDHRARVFTEAFYRALLGQKNVASAVREARQAARTAGDPTWLAYAVYAHPAATLTLDRNP